MKGAKTVFIKETREMGRDRRVLLGAFVMPVFMIALFVYLLGFVDSQVRDSSAAPWAIVTSGDPRAVDSFDQQAEIETVKVATVDEGRARLADRTVRLVVEFPPDLEQVGQEGEGIVRAWYDSADTLSQVSLSKLHEVVRQLNVGTASATLSANGIDPKFAEILTIERNDTATKTGMGGSFIVGLLPYMIVLWAFYGGMSIVSDLVAGEKERGTMETLLVSPVKRGEVALGKTLALGLVCLISGLTSLIGVLAMAVLPLPSTRDLFPEDFGLSASSIFWCSVLLVSLVAFFAAMMVSVSTYARNVRESQTYLTVISFMVLLPAIMSQFIGFAGSEEATWVALTPILNTAVALKMAMQGTVASHMMAGAVGWNLLLALVFLWTAVKLFRREDVILRV